MRWSPRRAARSSSRPMPASPTVSCDGGRPRDPRARWTGLCSAVAVAGVRNPDRAHHRTPAPGLENEVGDLAVVLRKPFQMRRLIDLLASSSYTPQVAMGDLTTVVLADDHALVRDMLCERLSREGWRSSRSRRPGSAPSSWRRPTRRMSSCSTSTCRGCPRSRPRVRFSGVSPSTRVIFLSTFVHDCYVEQALEVGASGYLTKSDPPQAIVDAIRR